MLIFSFSPTIGYSTIDTTNSPSSFLYILVDSVNITFENSYFSQSRFSSSFAIEIWNPLDQAQYLNHSSISRKFDIQLLNNNYSFYFLAHDFSNVAGTIEYKPNMTLFTNNYDLWVYNYSLDTFPDGEYAISLNNSLDYLNKNVYYINSSLTVNNGSISLHHDTLPNMWGKSYIQDSFTPQINYFLLFINLTVDILILMIYALIGLFTTFCIVIVYRFYQILNDNHFTDLRKELSFLSPIYSINLILLDFKKNKRKKIIYFSEENNLLIEKIIQENFQKESLNDFK